MTRHWFQRLTEWLGIGTADDCGVSDQLAEHDRRIDRLDVRVRALEADVAARVNIEAEGDDVAAAN
jgi:cell division protein FtsB